jgi:hypothetical protein
MTRRRWRSLLPAIDEARREERSKYGETVFLLEPNVSCSRAACGFGLYSLDRLRSLWRERL